jgi:hypothetical protein
MCSARPVSGANGGDLHVDSLWTIPEGKYNFVGCFPDVEFEFKRGDARCPGSH